MPAWELAYTREIVRTDIEQAEPSAASGDPDYRDVCMSVTAFGVEGSHSCFNVSASSTPCFTISKWEYDPDAPGQTFPFPPDDDVIVPVPDPSGTVTLDEIVAMHMHNGTLYIFGEISDSDNPYQVNHAPCMLKYSTTTSLLNGRIASVDACLLYEIISLQYQYSGGDRELFSMNGSPDGGTLCLQWGREAYSGEFIDTSTLQIINHGGREVVYMVDDDNYFTSWGYNGDFLPYSCPVTVAGTNATRYTPAKINLHIFAIESAGDIIGPYYYPKSYNHPGACPDHIGAFQVASLRGSSLFQRGDMWISITSIYSFQGRMGPITLLADFTTTCKTIDILQSPNYTDCEEEYYEENTASAVTMTADRSSICSGNDVIASYHEQEVRYMKRSDALPLSTEVNGVRAYHQSSPAGFDIRCMTVSGTTAIVTDGTGGLKNITMA